MSKNAIYSTDELRSFVQQFYSYFSDGYKFEEFLKIYLEKLGFEEVVVTKRSRDGGIDLTASRPAIGLFGTENYFIQAKRNKPNNTVSPEKIRALRGSMNTYGKGVFITTASVSNNTKDDALHFDPSKPIIVIDGADLVESCINLEVGFSFKPIFSKSSLDILMNTSDSSPQDISEVVEKEITANDIRARIISIPKFIMDKIPAELNEINVSVNDDEPIKLSITRGRNYLARVTALFNKYSLVDENGAAIPRKARWRINPEEEIIYIEIL